jgi:hypothetical protein
MEIDRAVIVRIDDIEARIQLVLRNLPAQHFHQPLEFPAIDAAVVVAIKVLEVLLQLLQVRHVLHSSIQ